MKDGQRTLIDPQLEDIMWSEINQRKKDTICSPFLRGSQNFF